MSDVFSEAEVAAIRKFLDWATDGNWIGYDEGITGVQDEGITCTEFSAVSDYDSYTLERDTTFIPWLALTDPDAYAAQVEAEEAERRRQQAAQTAANARHREAQERAAYEALKAKYG